MGRGDFLFFCPFKKRKQKKREGKKEKEKGDEREVYIIIQKKGEEGPIRTHDKRRAQKITHIKDEKRRERNIYIKAGVKDAKGVGDKGCL